MLEAETENQRALMQSWLDEATVDGAVLLYKDVNGETIVHGPMDAAFVVRVAPVIGATGTVTNWTFWINLQMGDLDDFPRVHVVRVVDYKRDPGLGVYFVEENGRTFSVEALMPGTDPQKFVCEYRAWEKAKLAESDRYRAIQNKLIDAAAAMAAQWSSSSWGDAGP